MTKDTQQTHAHGRYLYLTAWKEAGRDVWNRQKQAGGSQEKGLPNPKVKNGIRRNRVGERVWKPKITERMTMREGSIWEKDGGKKIGFQLNSWWTLLYISKCIKRGRVKKSTSPRETRWRPEVNPCVRSCVDDNFSTELAVAYHTWGNLTCMIFPMEK